MSAPVSITVTPVLVAHVLVAEGERIPVYVHVIDHPDARLLVDTGMKELHPAVADLDPHLRPLSEQNFDLASIDIVINSHLHFDHCGGNHLFTGRPIYLQRRKFELLPGVRLVPAPDHTRGTQVVAVETGGHPVVIAGHVAVWLAHQHEPWRPHRGLPLPPDA